MASMMKRDDSIAYTPEELDAWISGRPEIQDALQKGGYGRAFHAGDLLPLLHVFIGPEHLKAPHEESPTRPSRNLLYGGALLAILLFLLLLFVLLR
jgi:hypothetical protein